MTTKFAETTLWQRNLASLIRSGLFGRAEVVTIACGVLLGAVCVAAALVAGTWNFILT